MSLTPQHVADVQRTWELCIPIADTAADIFYTRLFELDPRLRSLFPSEMKEQKKKLMMMITAAVRGLSDLDKLVPVVQDLGRRHAGYRVTDEHYATVGMALIDTLRKGLGEHFTLEVEQGWVEVYGVLSTTMIEAARQVKPA
jgi:hemoglobin-like flavoprotein